MKRLVVIICFCLPFIASAQNIDRKAQRKIDKKEQHENLKQFLSDSTWVLTAHTLRDRRGNNAFVNPTTNFVAIAGKEAVIQIATNNFEPGLNGLGGQTLEGRLTNYKIKDRGLGKGFDIRMDFTGVLTFNIWISITDSGNASLQLSGLRGQRITYLGDLGVLEGSGIFVGNTRFF
ncbi:MAG: hypothetical protein Sapg2KO_50550 [Saprospiraceae bacterium]